MSNALRFLTLLVSLSAVIFIHEGGHYLACRVSGLHVNVVSVGIGPEMVEATVDGTKFVFKPLLVAGYTEFVPAEFARLSFWRKALVHIGGMLAGTLTAVPVVLWWVHAKKEPLFLRRLTARAPNRLAAYAIGAIAPFVVWITAPYFFIHAIFVRPSAEMSATAEPFTFSHIFTHEGVVSSIALLSMMLAGTNLVPVAPLDGGNLANEIITSFSPVAATWYAAATNFKLLLLLIIGAPLIKSLLKKKPTLAA